MSTKDIFRGGGGMIESYNNPLWPHLYFYFYVYNNVNK